MEYFYRLADVVFKAGEPVPILRPSTVSCLVLALSWLYLLRITEACIPHFLMLMPEDVDFRMRFLNLRVSCMRASIWLCVQFIVSVSTEFVELIWMGIRQLEKRLGSASPNR